MRKYFSSPQKLFVIYVIVGVLVVVIGTILTD